MSQQDFLGEFTFLFQRIQQGSGEGRGGRNLLQRAERHGEPGFVDAVVCRVIDDESIKQRQSPFGLLMCGVECLFQLQACLQFGRAGFLQALDVGGIAGKQPGNTCVELSVATCRGLEMVGGFFKRGGGLIKVLLLKQFACEQELSLGFGSSADCAVDDVFQQLCGFFGLSLMKQGACQSNSGVIRKRVIRMFPTQLRDEPAQILEVFSIVLP